MGNAKVLGKFNAKAREGADIGKFSTGTQYVLAKFEILDGEYKGNVYDWRGMLTANSQERTYQGLIACGCTFPGEDPTNFAGIAANVVQVTLEDEPQYGVRVSWVDPAGGRGMRDEDRVTGPEKKMLAAGLKGMLRSLKGGTPPTAAKTAAASAKRDPFAVDGAAGGESYLASDVAANDGAQQQATGTDASVPF